MLSSIPDRFTRLDAIVLILVAVLGLLNLTAPFLGDQAFFTLGALELQQGKLLYQDFWDLKQPGIFYLYALGGQLFGFTEIGIHSVELLLFLAFSVGLQRLASTWVQRRSLASFTPLFCVGYYYAIADPWDLTQLEALVGMPLLISFTVARWAAQGQGWRRYGWLLAGICGGIVLLFKLLFLLLLLPLWLLALGEAIGKSPTGASSWGRDPQSWRMGRALQGAMFLAIGLALPILCTLAPYAQTGNLGLLYDTFIVLPPRILAELPGAPIQRFVESTLWFVSRFAPLLLLASIGVWVGYRRRDPFTLGLVLWCVMGLIVVCLQKQAWWHYYYLVLMTPIGLLAVQGCDRLGRHPRVLHSIELQVRHLQGRQARGWGPRIGILVLLLASLLPLGLLLRKTYEVTTAGVSPWLGLAQRHPEEALVAHWIDRPHTLGGDIYVAGNPVYYLLSGRQQANRLNGWALEFFLPAQWEQLKAELQQAHPPYLFIEPAYGELIDQRSPGLADWIRRHYDGAVLPQGIWYRERDRHSHLDCVATLRHPCS